MKFKISTYIKELFLFLLLVAATLLVLIATHKASHTRTIVINEVCSNDFSLVENSAGKYADYIELYNAGDTTISLLNWTRIPEKRFRNVHLWRYPSVTTGSCAADP